MLLTPNLGWVNLPLRQIIHDRLGLTAALDNDANCAVLGEWWIGAARGTRHAIGLTIGTGIGGGIILDGELYHGASDWPARSATRRSTPRAAAASAATTAASRPTPRDPTSRCAPCEAIEAGAESRAAQRTCGGDLETDHRPDRLRGRARRRRARARGGERHRQVPRRRHRQPGQRLQSRGRGRLRRRDARGRPPVRARSGARWPAARSSRRSTACRIVPGELTGTAGVYGAAQDVHRWISGVPKVGILGSLVWDLIYGRDPARAAGRGVGRDRVRARRARRQRCRRTGRSCRSSRWAGPRRRGAASSCAGSQHLAPGAPLRRGAGAQQPGRAPLPLERAALRADVRRRARVDLGRAGPDGAGPRRHLPELHLRLRADAGHRAGAAAGFDGPIYADLHSLLPRHAARWRCGCSSPLPDAAAWFGCFDVVQLNEDEMRQLSPDPLSLAGARRSAAGVSLLIVTLGPRGSGVRGGAGV